ncbi:peroxisomal short-chain alcohol dehydrogenase [Fusarium beomiforme]|uniref:Peroxisomal short-chain alcohol dehydrogenase n=1 Tax=Fusarium beomiforme TaxID=44412 RepID=A0A9P5AN67_9HYPO|nr:peroxisomal short-chain alcohol dehydrogenase [Fusarium beomiforme]
MNSATATINGIVIRNHVKPYEAISPQRPELSQAGRTVLVCGGSTGIGHAIARNYCIAGASHIIILGRRSDVAKGAASKLNEAYPNSKVTTRTCDVFNRDQAQQLWDDLKKEDILIDVLILNAVSQPALQPILEQGADRLWQDFENNVHAPLYLLERFYKQPGQTKQKFAVSVSTQDIHRWDSAPQMPGYQLTKNSFAATVQQIARDTPESDMRIISFHPSIVFTEAAQKAGYTEDTLPWTDENIPGGFAVWAASPEAQFLHGRFVWSTWDVTDLQSGELRSQIDEDPWLLKVGVKGL